MRRLTWRSVAIAALALGPLAAAGLLGGAWYYSDELKNGALVPTHDKPTRDLVVAAVGEGQVTLRTTPETCGGPAGASPPVPPNDA